MSGLSPADLLRQGAEAIGRTAEDVIASAATVDTDESTTSGVGLPDGTPSAIEGLIARAGDRSRLHHEFVLRCVAHNIADTDIVTLAARYAPSVDKYGKKLEHETKRSIAKARDWLSKHPDAAERIRQTDSTDIDPSLQPVDLLPVLAGEVTQPMPTILQRHDGRSLFYPGQINGIHGDSGTGKGWVICCAIVQEFAAGNTVLLIDLEDVASSIVGRLRSLGATDTQIARQFVYIRPTVSLSDDTAVHHLLGVIAEREPTLAVVDSLGEAFGLDGIDENKDAEVGPWLRKVARAIADAGPATIGVDHSTKANDNPLHPSGSKRKRAAIGGHSILLTATKPLGKGKVGRLKLTCAKDRHGNYSKGETVGFMSVDSDDTGTTVRATLWAPDPTEARQELPVELVAREAARLVAAHHDTDGQPLSKTALRAQIKTKCATDIKRGGIDLAIDRQWIAATPGKSNSTHLSPGPVKAVIPDAA